MSKHEVKTKKSFYLSEGLIGALRRYCASLPGKRVSESSVVERAVEKFLRGK